MLRPIGSVESKLSTYAHRITSVPGRFVDGRQSGGLSWLFVAGRYRSWLTVVAGRGCALLAVAVRRWSSQRPSESFAREIIEFPLENRFLKMLLTFRRLCPAKIIARRCGAPSSQSASHAKFLSSTIPRGSPATRGKLIYR